MIIRRNTKVFNALQGVIESFAGKQDRQRAIKLYSVKSGEKLSRKVDLSRLSAAQRDFYYGLTYEAIRQNFAGKKTLHRSDKNEHLYFFRSGQQDETPFELKGKLQKTYRLYGRRKAAAKKKAPARKSTVRKDRSPRMKPARSTRNRVKKRAGKSIR